VKSERDLSPSALAIVRQIKKGHTCLRIVTSEESDAREACVEAAMHLGWPVLVWDAVQGVHDGMVAGNAPISGTQTAEAGLRYLQQAPSAVMMIALDTGPFLKDDPRALRAWRQLTDRLAEASKDQVPGALGCLMMVDHHDHGLEIVRSHSTPLELPLPVGEEVAGLVRAVLRSVHRQNALEVKLQRRELEAIEGALHGLSRRQIQRVIRDVVLEDRRLDSTDIASVLTLKRKLLQDAGPLEPVEAPASLDDIGGLVLLKQWLKQRERALSSDASEFGIDPPRGVLLLGVQGAGKSLCAKAIATAWHRPLLRLDAGALYDKFIGESEKRLRDALNQAEAMAPVILWIDEIEKAFAGASSQSSDGGLSRRMFGALLTWMQEHRSPVFLVATANDISALPPELLRKGRFDEIFFVDLPGRAAREQIVKIHLKRRKRDLAKFDVARLVEATAGYSGAEIEQTIIMGLYAAFGAGREVTTEDILEAAKASPPLSRTRAEQIQELRAWGKERCRPADVVE
jgi:ATP-dependent 26S proteasome regulatory subunit